MANGQMINKEINNMQPKETKSSKHFNISMAKSTLRIAAALLLISGELFYSGLAFIVAELGGIAEEF